MIFNNGIQLPDRLLVNRIKRDILANLTPIKNRISNVEIDVSENVVTITGIVTSYYDRQLCIMSCRKASNFLQINDMLQVVN